MTFACSVCITKKVVANYGPGLLMGFSSLFGSILVLPLALSFSKPGVLHSCMVGWWPLTILVVIGTALGYCLYYGSMKYISAYMASMTFLLKPVLACFLAVCFAGEKMNAWTVSGTIIIVLSLLVTNIPFGKRKA
ncbi:MAG: DMT family transporter [Lentisphaeria bacterium]|nr:DMT family transporter [Lentisphaeria bacterium]